MIPIITVKPGVARNIKAALKRRIKRVENFRAPLTMIAQDFYSVEKAWFASKGGGRWKPLSPRYAAWKKQFFPGKPIMRMNDLMWKEFTGQPGHMEVRRNQMRIYVKGVDYWKKHHWGVGADYKRGRGGKFVGGMTGSVPQRILVSPVLEVRHKAWHQIVTEWLTSKLDVQNPEVMLKMGKKF